MKERQLEDLRTEREAGLTDVKAGRVKPFDAEQIVKKGNARFARRAPST